MPGVCSHASGTQTAVKGMSNCGANPGRSFVLFFSQSCEFQQNKRLPKVAGTFACALRRVLIFFCVTHLTSTTVLTLCFFPCFAKDETAWDCTDSMQIPICRLMFLVGSVNGHYTQCYSSMLQSVFSEDFVGFSGRGTK